MPDSKDAQRSQVLEILWEFDLSGRTTAELDINFSQSRLAGKARVEDIDVGLKSRVEVPDLQVVKVRQNLYLV